MQPQHTSASRPMESIVIGGGPAGTAAAIRLARQGNRVTILERSRSVGDAICGGFLSWSTLAALQQLGIEAQELGGQEVNQLRLFANAKSLNVALPRAALGVSRHRLDSVMQRTAQRAGAIIERGVRVRSVTAGNEIICKDSSARTAEAIFLAVGKHELASHKRTRPQRLANDPMLGLRVRLPASAALQGLVDNSIELHLFDRGYAGLALQEHGSGNLCLAVHQSRLSEAGGSPAALVAMLAAENPQLGERLPADVTQLAFDAIAAVPYGYCTSSTQPGQFLLGDQAAVIPSLAGEGIGIALASARYAIAAFVSDGGAGACRYQQTFAAAARRPLYLAGWAARVGQTPRISAIALNLPVIAPAFIRTLLGATRIN